jgi:hypothetical protein
MYEYVINLHMHTCYSDGDGTHAEIASAAIQAGIDAVIITDHNVLVQGMQGYYEEDDKRLLVLVGEEIHDQARQPQKNHMLVLGAERELAHLAADPQNLIKGVSQAGGICFLAHPIDPEAPAFGELSLSWVSWDIVGYTGIELWNAMTEFKGLLTDKRQAYHYGTNFDQVAHGPFPETLELWDRLLVDGINPVVAIGGSDAHQTHASMGPFKRVLFPYEQHFKAVNTHILTETPFNGEFEHDRRVVLDALSAGHCFIGYNLPASTTGFRFTAHRLSGIASMGDTIESQGSATLQVKFPQRVEGYLLKDGERVATANQRDSIIHIVDGPGIYRVEAYLEYKKERRGWIFSNPIYVR